MRVFNPIAKPIKAAAAAALAISALTLVVPAAAQAQTTPTQVCVTNSAGVNVFVDASLAPAGYTPCTPTEQGAILPATTSPTTAPGVAENLSVNAAANNGATSSPASTLAATAPTTGGLAFTGADIAGVTGIGIILIGIGGAILFSRRRTNTNN